MLLSYAFIEIKKKRHFNEIGPYKYCLKLIIFVNLCKKILNINEFFFG